MKSRVGMTACALTLVLAGCQLHGKGSDDDRRPSEDHDDSGDNRGFSERGLDTEDDVVAYARYCKQVLDLPEAPLAPFNCLDGAEIPITVDGKRPDRKTFEKLRRGEIGCDKPAWLGDVPCANYTFVQRRALSPDVDATLLCRTRSFASDKTKAERLADYQKDPTFEKFRTLYDFKSLGLIWTSKKTGHTCYFDFVGTVFGGYVPSPDVATLPSFEELPDPKPPKKLPDGVTEELVWRKDARTTWRTPKQVVDEKDNCVRCHDAGPYKATPYILQVFDVPANDVNLPYIVVGRAFASWKKAFPLFAVSTAPLPGKDGGAEEPQLCTSCHRIGSQATCQTFLGYSIGQTSSNKLSALGATFMGRTWMPPAVADWETAADDAHNAHWNEAFGRHVDRLNCCCNNPKAKGCTLQALGVAPLGSPKAGEGPESCL